MTSSIRTRSLPVALLSLSLMAALLVLPMAPVLAQQEELALDGETREQAVNLQEQADAVKAEIEELDRSLERVVEQYNETRINLDQLTFDLADSRHRLDRARDEHNAQRQLIADRLVVVYKADDINIVQLLLSSDDIYHFIDQLRYMTVIGDRDAKLEKQLKASATEIGELTESIDNQRSDQMELEDQLEKQQQDIEARLDDRQAKYDGLSAGIQQILDEEDERQRAEQATAAREAAEQLGNIEIEDATLAQVVETALVYLDVPYVWGGESPTGLDCSGLTKYVFAQHGVELPHFAASQFNMGVPVEVDDLLAGDLIFWGPGYPHHVGMYIAAGKYIEASFSSGRVVISNLEIDADYAGARRFELGPRS